MSHAVQDRLAHTLKTIGDLIEQATGPATVLYLYSNTVASHLNGLRRAEHDIQRELRLTTLGKMCLVDGMRTRPTLATF
jgi:hypothetical protein